MERGLWPGFGACGLATCCSVRRRFQHSSTTEAPAHLWTAPAVLTSPCLRTPAAAPPGPPLPSPLRPRCSLPGLLRPSSSPEHLSLAGDAGWSAPRCLPCATACPRCARACRRGRRRRRPLRCCRCGGGAHPQRGCRAGCPLPHQVQSACGGPGALQLAAARPCRPAHAPRGGAPPAAAAPPLPRWRHSQRRRSGGQPRCWPGPGTLSRRGAAAQRPACSGAGIDRWVRRCRARQLKAHHPQLISNDTATHVQDPSQHTSLSAPSCLDPTCPPAGVQQLCLAGVLAPQGRRVLAGGPVLDGQRGLRLRGVLGAGKDGCVILQKSGKKYATVRCTSTGALHRAQQCRAHMPARAGTPRPPATCPCCPASLAAAPRPASWRAEPGTCARGGGKTCRHSPGAGRHQSIVAHNRRRCSKPVRLPSHVLHVCVVVQDFLQAHRRGKRRGTSCHASLPLVHKQA